MKPSVLFVTETWLSPKIFSSELTSDLPYTVLRCDRASRGGGVCVLYRNHLSISIFNTSRVSKCDLLSLDVHSPSASPTRIILCYRPPNLNSQGNSLFFDTLSDLCSVPSPIVLLGDFNLHLDWNSPQSCSGQSLLLYHLFASMQLTQFVKKPTLGSHFLDIILASDPFCISECTVEAPFSGSDHSSVYFHLNLSSHSLLTEQKYDFAKGQYSFLSNALMFTDWVNLLSDSSNIDELWSRISSYLRHLLSKYIPMKTFRVPFSEYPPHIRSLLHHKNLLFGKLALGPVTIQYKEVCAKLEREILKYTRNRDNHLLRNVGSRSFYNTISARLKTRPTLSTLLDSDGSVITSQNNIANSLATYFESVYITDNGITPPFHHRISSDFSLGTFFPHEVRKHLFSLKPSLSLTIDNIPAIVYKKCAQELAEPLSYLFNLSIISGEFPTEWKSSIVVPIPKSSHPRSVSDFRPISLTPIPSRVFERLIRARILRWSRIHRLIPETQYGFVSGKSVSGQLLECTQKWRESLDKGENVDVAYIDISKAFDSVSHTKLLHKLENFGFRRNILVWFSNYLSERQFQVRVGSSLSSTRFATSGVPQGTVLGPLLFLLYISDIPAVLQRFSLVDHRMFADDIKLFVSYGSAHAPYAHVQLSNALSALSTYLSDWQLSVAAHKSNILYVGKHNPKHAYMINACLVPETSEIRDLGVIVDHKFEFKTHITSMCTRATSLVFFLFRSFKCSTPNFYVQAYKSYVLPILEFASPVWSPYHKHHIKAIEKVQHLFTRLVFLRCPSSFSMQSQLLPSYSSRLLSLALHPLVARRVASDCAFALGLIHGRHKQSPSTFFTFRASFGRIGQFELTVRSYKSNNLRYSCANRIVRYLPRLSALELPLSSKFIRRLLLQHPLFTTRLDICVDI